MYNSISYLLYLQYHILFYFGHFACKQYITVLNIPNEIKPEKMITG